MSALLASVVDGRALVETVLASLVAGVGITIVFSLAILGAALFGNARRDGRIGMAVAGASLMGVGLAASLGAIAAGLVAMTS